MKRAGLLTASLAGACSSNPAPSAPPKPRLKLAPVKVSKDRILRTVVGLRPFRSFGFPGGEGEARAENRRPQLWPRRGRHHALLGNVPARHRRALSRRAAAGSCRRPRAPERSGSPPRGSSRDAGVEVTIYAKALPPQTTSNIAAGQWSPYFVSDFSKRSARFKEQFAKAARLSHRQFQISPGRSLRRPLPHELRAERSPVRRRRAVTATLPGKRISTISFPSPGTFLRASIRSR